MDNSHTTHTHEIMAITMQERAFYVFLTRDLSACLLRNKDTVSEKVLALKVRTSGLSEVVRQRKRNIYMCVYIYIKQK